MALPVQPTLEEITGEVLRLIGEGGEGTASAQLYGMTQAFARRAQANLYLKAAWVFNRIRMSVALPGSTSTTLQTIDWPDNMRPGHLVRVSAVIASDPKHEWTLDHGITPQDRSTWNFGGFATNVFAPFKYDFLNGLIELGPNNSEATTLYLQGDGAPAPLTNPGDRIGCDGEALIRLTAIMLCNRLGGEYRDGLPSMQEEYQDYLRDLRPRQGNGEPVVPGSQWAIDDPARPVTGVMSQRHWMWRSRRP